MLYVVPLLNIAAAVGVNKFIYRPKNKKILGERVSEGASTCGGSGSLRKELSTEMPTATDQFTSKASAGLFCFAGQPTIISI